MFEIQSSNRHLAVITFVFIFFVTLCLHHGGIITFIALIVEPIIFMFSFLAITREKHKNTGTHDEKQQSGIIIFFIFQAIYTSMLCMCYRWLSPIAMKNIVLIALVADAIATVLCAIFDKKESKV